MPTSNLATVVAQYDEARRELDLMMERIERRGDSHINLVAAVMAMLSDRGLAQVAPPPDGE